MTPKELCDENAQKFKDAWKALDIDYSKFIRTTDDYHEKAVQKIFKKLVEKVIFINIHTKVCTAPAVNASLIRKI